MAYVARPADFHATRALPGEVGTGSPSGNAIKQNLRAVHRFRETVEPYSPAVTTPAHPPRQKPRPGLLRRFFDAIMDGRQRRAQRDIDYYVATHGRRMTDSMEREINSLILGENWTVRR